MKRNNKSRKWALCLALFGLLAAPWISVAQDLVDYERLVVFGDSLTADGNGFSGLGCARAPAQQYCDGRFSNGPVWVEYAREALDVALTNMACAGAETGFASPRTGAPGLLRQVEQFIDSRGGGVPATWGYFLWAGANDLMGISSEGAIDSVVDRTVANIMRALDRLRAAGARRMVVVNAPDIGLVPLADHSVLALSPEVLSAASRQFSLRLTAAIRTRRHKVVIVDTLSAHRRIVANPSQVGLANVGQSCLENGCETGVFSACAKQGHSSGAANRYLYWDSLHPTTKGHSIIAEEIVSSALLRINGDWIGLYDSSANRFRLDRSLKGGATEWQAGFSVARGERMAIAGDWLGTGEEGIGLYVRKKRRVRLALSRSAKRAQIRYKIPSVKARMLPIAGDWDGNGTVTMGFYDPRRGRFLLKNRHDGLDPEVRYRFGPKGKAWQPIAGDWDGDGRDNVGLYDPDSGVFRLRNEHRPGSADRTVRFGPTGGARYALAGDWDGDGVDGVGVYQTGLRRFLLRDSLPLKPIDFIVPFGSSGAKLLPVSGKWADLPP